MNSNFINHQSISHVFLIQLVVNLSFKLLSISFSSSFSHPHYPPTLSPPLHQYFYPAHPLGSNTFTYFCILYINLTYFCVLSCSFKCLQALLHTFTYFYILLLIFRGGAINWLRMNDLEFDSTHPHGYSWGQYRNFLLNTLFSYFK